MASYIMYLASLLSSSDISPILESCALDTAESPNSAITAAIVPKRINGVRLPSFERHLSDMTPKSGSMNSARILSSAMIKPETACDIPKRSVSILGIIVS